MNNELPVNAFDLAIFAYLLFAIFAGFRSGLLRSLATIFGYVIAAPVAVAVMPYLQPIISERLHLPTTQGSFSFFAVFFAIGMILAALLRGAVGEISGKTISAPDRAAGALLGAVRVVMLAISMP